MAHVRQQLRQAGLALALTLAIPGLTASTSRAKPLERAALPHCSVFTLAESSEPLSMGTPQRLERTAELVFRFWTQGEQGVDDFLDDCAVKLEVAMSADRKLGGLCKQSWLALTSDLIQSDESQTPIAGLELHYVCMYQTFDATPEVAA